ncbi:MAG: hypothetical protein U0X91_02475 [Spirosomataceae bacterium]
MSIFKKPWLFLCLIPVFLLAFVLYKNSINLPVGDDVYVMGMFNLWKEADAWTDKLGVLFSQHNEHRLVITRLLALLQYSISGFIDLRWWIILGNVSLPFIVLLFYRHIGKPAHWILPVAFVIISPCSNTLIAMQNSNLFSALFAVATIHFSLKPSSYKNSGLVFVCSWLSIFSNSGGFALLAVISVVFIYQKKYRLLTIWLGWAVLLIVGYYWNYENIYRHPTSQLIFDQWPKVAEFFFAFLGSIAFSPTLAPITGVAFVGLALLAFYKKYYLQNPFVFLCIAYSLLMAAMTTYKRYEYGINTAMSERYSIYSMILTAGIIILLRDFSVGVPFSKKVVFPGLLTLSVLINLKYVTFHLRHPENRKEELMSKMENYHLNHSGFNCFEVNILDKLGKYGFYRYRSEKSLHPKAYYDSLNRPPLRFLTLRMDTVYLTGNQLHLAGKIINPPADIAKINQTHHRLWALHNATTPFDCTQYAITAPQNDETLILDMELENDRHKVSLPDFAITVPKKHFLKGNYTLYLLLVNDNPVNHPPIKSNIVFHL